MRQVGTQGEVDRQTERIAEKEILISLRDNLSLLFVRTKVSQMF